MNLHPTHIKVNSQTTTVESLLANRESTTGWERDWLDFLAEWYDERDVIEVKTSGSTGDPKTIRLKKDFVAASALRTIRFFNLKKGDKVLHCLPSQFIAGKLMVVRALIAKLDLHVVDPSGDFVSLQEGHPFKFTAMVTNQVEKYLQLDNQTLELLLIGGSSVPPALEQKLQTVGTRCYSSYAMTETATHIALRQLNGEGKDEWYHCLQDIHLSLDERGCIRIAMPGLDEGPLQTNDLAELLNEQTFRILGRADNRMISGGLKFSPEELEQKLEAAIKLPFYISSKAHDQLGQQLVLIVEGTDDEKLRVELKTICTNHLSRYERPREIIFVRQIARTGNGKLKRRPPAQL